MTPRLLAAVALACALLHAAPPPARAYDEFFEPADYAVLSIEKVNGKPFVARIKNVFTGRAYDYVPGDALGPTFIREVGENQVTLVDRLTRREYLLPVPRTTLDRQLEEKERDRHKVLFDEARRLFKIGQSKSASDKLKEALKLSPGFRDGHFLLAIIYHENRLYKDAFRHYREVASIDPKNHRAYYNLAQLFAETGNPNEAIYYLRRALGVKPDYERALNLYSSVQDQIEEARRSKGSMQQMQERERRRESLKAAMATLADEIRTLKADLEEQKIAAADPKRSAKEKAADKARGEEIGQSLQVKERLYEIQAKELEKLLGQ